MVRAAVDIGASYSKLVVLTDEGQMDTRLIKTRGFEETAIYLLDTAKQRHDLREAVVTGGGSSHLPSTLSGIRINRVDELQATGAGGLAMSGLKEAVVVSMGTGTAILHATEAKTTHLGGTGVGGGTLIGLSKLLIGETDPEKLEQLALE
ncbi:MAG: Fumble domain-containing protein, partial [Candidatus Bathyarchaeia archaeon]